MGWKQYCEPQKWHDSANIFPLLAETELNALAQNIRDNGLQNPIALFEGRVLDGRNRLLACAKVGVKPRFKKLNPNGTSPIEFVIAQNLERRHLTIDQRAALAARLIPKLAKEALTRQKAAGTHGAKGGRGRRAVKPLAQDRAKALGKSSEQAARLVGGVSARTVEIVIALAKRFPRILDQIISGETTLAKSSAMDHFHKVGALGPRDFVEHVTGIDKGALARRFFAPPFSVLDAKQPYWKARQAKWLTILDPALCQTMFGWFMPKAGGHIFDPFASECTQGIVAGCCGYQYTGIVTDKNQMKTNKARIRLVQINWPHMILPQWICCDPSALDKKLPAKELYDLIFSSPPFDETKPIDRGAFERVLTQYKEVFRQSVARLKWNRFVVLKIADVLLDKEGFIAASPEDVIKPMIDLGLRYYNRAILKMDSQGLGYGTLLCFWKGDRDKVAIRDALGVLDSVEDAKADQNAGNRGGPGHRRH